ncbi:TPA: hypothetical protein RUZ63_003392 [Vibrio cholerae]|uniref:hypothetical protein n=1 Tax=Vibrio TaxID=662 RepID=UPI0003793917|nr:MULTISPECIES: hypothetical protein [Vibrio]EJL6264454.1 hypothetical protein [Vibrio cholerae]ASO31062.1 hypothetical protein CG015_18010 [Vibrio anguillarum]EHU5194327.1 hypothetical protein [Vibrio parahaemolyticus]EJL6442095.1 hypothetical protein [Vibrio cholerae]EKF9303182.1 hypothetical protein [Vibrio cholerae]
MASQKEKYHKGMSGEYAVASELHRRLISASVTYGNYKSADVIAFSDKSEKSVIIEVKTTSKNKWVVGSSKLPPPSQKPWVFVHMPEDLNACPRFFVFTQSELHDLLEPIENEYYRKFKEKHGEDYGSRAGVVNLNLKQALPFENKWETLLSQLAG